MTNAIQMESPSVFGSLAPVEASAENPPEAVRRASRRPSRGVVLAMLALLALACWVAVSRPYTPGSTLGYNLGLIGGVMMLMLLLYPLRKRVRAFDRLGQMVNWFRFHMVAGIGGPLLILFHSTFKLGSLNGSIAFYAMLLVASSGIVGRFIYRHVHRGLYGSRLTLDEAKANLQSSQNIVNSVFWLRPDIETRLHAFQEHAFASMTGVGRRFWRFVTLRWQARRLAAAARQDVKSVLTHLLRERKLTRPQLAANYRLASTQIRDYLNAVVQTSQLAVWERLFSLWHIIHIPFIYLLLFAGIVHVLAVHMY